MSEVGDTIKLTNMRGSPEVRIIMEIIAPRGRILIFQSQRDRNDRDRYRKYEHQGEAIKAFMEQHRGE